MSAESILEEDKQAFRPLFAAIEESKVSRPVGDVLMIYARVEADGKIAGSADGLREIIRQSGAAIAVVASENDGKSYAAAGLEHGLRPGESCLDAKTQGYCLYAILYPVIQQNVEGQVNVVSLG
ncbi:MAG TPA: hypothetical protein VIX37_20865 [Candidatus Sulfotelmatobacter sp.]